MGSSTGDMLVDDKKVLEEIFEKSPMAMAVHCEDEETIKHNTQLAAEKYGEDIPIYEHPNIRSKTKIFINLLQWRLNLLKIQYKTSRISSLNRKRIELFDNTIPLSEKRITAEVCIHHLWFNEDNYKEKTYIKWNPR